MDSLLVLCGFFATAADFIRIHFLVLYGFFSGFPGFVWLVSMSFVNPLQSKTPDYIRKMICISDIKIVTSNSGISSRISVKVYKISNSW